MVSDTTDLIINEPKFDKRSSLYKTLKKQVEIKDFAELDENYLMEFSINESDWIGKIWSLMSSKIGHLYK